MGSESAFFQNYEKNRRILEVFNWDIFFLADKALGGAALRVTVFSEGVLLIERFFGEIATENFCEKYTIQFRSLSKSQILNL